jgi:hypothetical protein
MSIITFDKEGHLKRMMLRVLITIYVRMSGDNFCGSGELQTLTALMIIVTAS